MFFKRPARPRIRCIMQPSEILVVMAMESEPRHILSAALGTEEKREMDLAEAIRRRFLPFGGVDQLEPHPPVPIGNPPILDQ